MQLLATLLAALAGAHTTYWMTHHRRMNGMRAASLASLMFVAASQLSHTPFLIALQPAFFGSTYVAMSEPQRLSERTVLGASVVFGCILFILQRIDFVHFHGGIGGTLGGTAFLACLWFTGFRNSSWPCATAFEKRTERPISVC